jgi:hypothetical protein
VCVCDPSHSFPLPLCMTHARTRTFVEVILFCLLSLSFSGLGPIGPSLFLFCWISRDFEENTEACKEEEYIKK